MMEREFMHSDDIRTLFSRAMSDMYKIEVPLYGALCELVADANIAAQQRDPVLAQQLQREHLLGRLDVERHGAIRLGTPQELATICRLFRVMGMHPVGYYDLSVAGVPVHSTAFRPIEDASINHNPFRVFTSLLRLELIANPALRERAAAILARRSIFTPGCLASVTLAERQGGLTPAQARAFVAEALETFRWHADATVDLATYRQLRASHALVADIVCFKGPHINHLTPRTLDIDMVQAGMPARGIRAKESIEGPPPRAVPVLLRQTSFLALEEPIRFLGDEECEATHTARFGEIEQRGCAVTRKGRALYDELLGEALARSREGVPLASAMAQAFQRFPDEALALHRERLAFFLYRANPDLVPPPASATVDELVEGGWLRLEPLTYEDFLPVSAAGIFRSNLGAEVRERYSEEGNKAAFEAALQAQVLDEFALYEAAQATSLADCLWALHHVSAEVDA